MRDYHAMSDEDLERHLHRRAVEIGAKRDEPLEFRIEEHDGTWITGYWTRKGVPESFAPDGARLLGADATTKHQALVDFAALLEIDS
jgi:hypothetical protein